MLLALCAALAAGSFPIDPSRLSATVKTLASDAFEGRAPGSAGEEKTVAYLIDRFKELGLAPAGENGSFTQDVALVHTQVQPGAQISLEAAGKRKPLVQGEDIYLSTVQPVAHARIASLPIVFVGYGVSAPERGWDDYKGVDLQGKIALYLVNDPDFEAGPEDPVAGKFGGKAMTYYGRWTYKYEEAARRGAAAAIIVHETPGAGYGWVTVAAPHGENFDIAAAPRRVPVQGWLQRPVAVQLFQEAGLDFEALKVKARAASFHPIELPGVRLSADLPIAHSLVRSRNVLAKIPGAARPQESVMFSAHWDAYGIAPDGKGPDSIRRGAADDAIGVAGLFEIARAFKAEQKPPARTVIFGVWTAEERGLLGSEYFGEHPTVSLAKMAANYTIDILQTKGPARDVVLVGAGQNSLEQGLARAAAAQGRTITPDAKAERGLFYRADHFSLARRGVPVLLLMGIGGGADLVEGGRAAGDQWVSDYTAHCYHQACDAWSAAWDLRGAAQDVELLYRAGSEIARSDEWPTWNDGSEFKALRAQSAAERGAPEPDARSRIVPLVDHHQHLFSPDDAVLVNGPGLLPEIALPEDLAALLRSRESGWNSPAALEKLFVPNSVLLGGQSAGWIAGRPAVVEALSRMFSKPYRMIPVEYAVDGSAAQISGYLARKSGDSLRYLGYFSEQLVKDGARAWKIASETPVYPFREIQDPITAAKLIGMLDAAGIRRAVVLSEAFWFDGPFIQVKDPYAAVRKENDWTAEQAALFPERLVAFCSFNPLQDYALAELGRCAKSHRFAGLKLSFAMSGVDMKKPGDVSKVRQVFAAANGYRLPIVVHARGTEKYGEADVKIFLDQIVSAAPDVVVQVAHLWGGEAFSEDALSAYAEAVSARHPATRNLYFDVAEVTRSAHGSEAILRTVAQRLRRIGLERVLYGSDAALNGRLTPAEAWAQFRLEMPLTNAELSAIANNVAPYLRQSH